MEYLVIILGYFFLFLHKNIHNLGTSNEYPQCMFVWRTGENYPMIIIKLSNDNYHQILLNNSSDKYCTYKRQLILKVPSKIVANDILFFFNYFSEKIKT